MGSPPERDRTGPGVGRYAPQALAARAVGGRDVVGAVAHRVAQAEQDLVERRSRLIPPGLLDAIGLRRLPRPDLLQRRDLRAQVVERRVEPRRRGVDLLADGVLDLVEVVRQT